MAKIAKKTKKAKITSVTIRENRNKDWSPRWDDTESLSATEFLKHYHNAMHYYNIQFSGKDLKPAVLTWMTENGYEKSVITDFKKSKDWRVSTTMGAIASCLSRGMPEQRDDFNKGTNTKEWLINAINKVIDDSKNDVEPDDEVENKPTTQTVSIQERVREATFKMTEEIEDAIEVWMETPEKFDPKQFKILNLLKGKEVKAAHARVIKDYYSFGLKELSEVIEGKDEDLKEGYKYRNKKQINNLLAFYKEIDSACTMLMEEAKVLRKPRAKKAIPKDKIVEKLKFLKTFEPLKLVSVNPTDILGSKELWTYNTKTRKLGKYIADDMTGPLGIKGTTIIGYDEHKSVQKTIRKPEDKLKEFKSAGKIALRKFLEDINATDTKLNGRINEDIILLKVG
jgi:molybdopterin converting factor small subunit